MALALLPPPDPTRPGSRARAGSVTRGGPAAGPAPPRPRRLRLRSSRRGGRSPPASRPRPRPRPGLVPGARMHGARLPEATGHLVTSPMGLGHLAAAMAGSESPAGGRGGVLRAGEGASNPPVPPAPAPSPSPGGQGRACFHCHPGAAGRRSRGRSDPVTKVNGADDGGGGAGQDPEPSCTPPLNPPPPPAPRGRGPRRPAPIGTDCQRHRGWRVLAVHILSWQIEPRAVPSPRRRARGVRAHFSTSGSGNPRTERPPEPPASRGRARIAVGGSRRRPGGRADAAGEDMGPGKWGLRRGPAGRSRWLGPGGQHSVLKPGLRACTMVIMDAPRPLGLGVRGRLFFSPGKRPEGRGLTK